MIRSKAGTTVYLFCGCIFTGVGLFTLALSVVLAANMDYVRAHGRGDVELLPVVFGILGGISAAVGFALLVWVGRKTRMKRNLIERGDSVLANITGFPMDYSVRINGWPTFRVECSYLDTSGTLHVFRSDNLCVDPAYAVTQSQVRVYVDRGSGFRNYYVDVDSILPEIKQH